MLHVRKPMERVFRPYSRRVRVSLIHENLTESTRIPPISGFEHTQVRLKSTKGASVSQNFNGKTGKIGGMQTRGEESRQSATIMIDRNRLGDSRIIDERRDKETLMIQ